MLQRHILPTGMAVANSDGAPFDISHICASGNVTVTCVATSRPSGRIAFFPHASLTQPTISPRTVLGDDPVLYRPDPYTARHEVRNE
jgi:hypothetical protein